MPFESPPLWIWAINYYTALKFSSSRLTLFPLVTFTDLKKTEILSNTVTANLEFNQTSVQTTNSLLPNARRCNEIKESRLNK